MVDTKSSLPGGQVSHESDVPRQRIVLDVASVRRALEEGREAGRAFDRATAGMRVLTADDLKTRCR